jgi:tape measure domain-containing protein
MTQSLQLALLLKAEAGQMVGQVRAARDEVQRLGEATRNAAAATGPAERATSTQVEAARKLEASLRPATTAAKALQTAQSALPASLAPATRAVDAQTQALERLSEAERRAAASPRPAAASGTRAAPAGASSPAGLDASAAQALGLGQALTSARAAGAWLLGGGAAAAAMGFGQAIAEAGDKAASLRAALTQLTGSRTALAEVSAVAQRVGVSVDEVGASFRRLALVKDDIGLTTREVASLTQTVLQLGRISGAGPQELAAGAMQLAQALASGRLQGDELRSILENIPALAQVLARGLGVSTAELRKMGEEGRLTADVVAGVLGAAAESVNRRFAELPETLAQAGARAANEWQGLLGDLDAVFQASTLKKSVMGWLGDAMRQARLLLGSQDQALLASVGRSPGQLLDAAKEDAAATRAELERLREGNTPNLFGVGRNEAAIAATEARLRDLEGRIPALADELERVSGQARTEAEAETAKVVEARATRTRAALGEIGADMDKAFKPLLAPAEKIAEINRQLEETRKKLEALRGKPGADGAAIDAQLGRAEDLAARRRAEVTAAERKQQATEARRADDELRRAAEQTQKVLDGLARRRLGTEDPRRAFIEQSLAGLPTGAGRAERSEVERAAGLAFDAELDRQARARDERDRQAMARQTEMIELQGRLAAARAAFDAGAIDQAALDAEERRIELLRQGVDLETEQSRLYLERAQQTDAEIERGRRQAQQLGEIRRFSDAFGDSVVSGLERGRRAGESFQDILKDIGLDLAQLAIRAAFLEPASRGISGGVSGLLQAGLSLFGGGPVASAKGNVFMAGDLVPFASGGVVQKPTLFPMAGGKRGLMGEAGPEAIMPLVRLGNGRLGVQAAGGGAAAPARQSVTTINVDARGMDQGAMDMRIEAAIRRALPALQARMVETAERSWR